MVETLMAKTSGSIGPNTGFDLLEIAAPIAFLGTLNQQNSNQSTKNRWSSTRKQFCVWKIVGGYRGGCDPVVSLGPDFFDTCGKTKL